MTAGSSRVQLTPIGVIRSCFREKFGIPRQPGLVPDSRAILKLDDNQDFRDALRGIEEFSHIWVITVFHEHVTNGRSEWKSLVRPPRLGGEKKMGVFATRSPHRPNPLGISAVQLERVDLEAKDGPELHLSGIDFLDGTPVLDIKPYVPYSDSIAHAAAGWTKHNGTDVPRTKVEFAEEALASCEAFEKQGYPGFKNLIRQIIEQDPRPAFQTRRAQDPQASEESYACRLYDFDVRWKVHGETSTVLEIADLRSGNSS